MKKKKIACIIGARPQFIKHFPLEMQLAKEYELITIHTGQHFDYNMSRVFFDQLGLKQPSYHFNLTKSSHGAQTAEMLTLIEDVLMNEAVDVTLVYGDTNSTIAGALAAAKLNIPVIHVEAGLRSFNKTMPEELNRVITDHISDLLFCASETGVNNLKNEGIYQGVYLCGDLMKDALIGLLPSLEHENQPPYILATLHRPYNTDNVNRLRLIISKLYGLECKVIFPMHPRTRKILENDNFDFLRKGNIEFVDPVGYIEMLGYMKFAEKIITDSGGIQKEAYWLKKKCITIRTETEWVETLIGGWNSLVFDELESLTEEIMPDPFKYNPNLYGDGKAASQITDVIRSFF